MGLCGLFNLDYYCNKAAISQYLGAMKLVVTFLQVFLITAGQLARTRSKLKPRSSHFQANLCSFQHFIFNGFLSKADILSLHIIVVFNFT